MDKTKNSAFISNEITFSSYAGSTVYLFSSFEYKC